MLLKKHQVASITFVAFCVLDIIAVFLKIEWLHYIAKPLLMPALIVLFLTTENKNKAKLYLIISALIFSWLGDVFLLAQDNKPLFFILGLTSFLTTHILYIVYFYKIAAGNFSTLKKNRFIVLLVAAYGIGLLWILCPHLAQMKIPVVIYATVICTMLLCSINIRASVNNIAFNYFLAGALFLFYPTHY
ncbi:MAG: lysoplasmalogenase [Chitinophagaceae bacterium]|nr:lysoplasmalogenase [Chitinophagaceae bacterium]